MGYGSGLSFPSSRKLYHIMGDGYAHNDRTTICEGEHGHVVQCLDVLHREHYGLDRLPTLAQTTEARVIEGDEGDDDN